MWSELSGPKSWLFSLVLGLPGALARVPDLHGRARDRGRAVFDFGGIFGAIIGVIILLPFVGIFTRFVGRHRT